jgi:hypothetical protein
MHVAATVSQDDQKSLKGQNKFLFKAHNSAENPLTGKPV